MTTKSDIADASHRTAQLAEAERQVVEAAVAWAHGKPIAHANNIYALDDAVARLEKLRGTK